MLDEAAWAAAQVDRHVHSTGTAGRAAGVRSHRSARALRRRHLYIGVRAYRVARRHRHRNAPRCRSPVRRGQLPGHPRHLPRFAQRLHVPDDAAWREARAAGLRRRRRRRPRHARRTSIATGTACGTRPREIVDDGWTAEIAIPFSTVRFVPSDAQIWGINFQRNIRRKNESVFWSPIPKAYRLTRVSMAGELHGLSASRAASTCKLKPFMVGGVHDVQTSAHRQRPPMRSATSVSTRATASPPASTSTSPINTDFAQVEVDEQQVNLTRFGLFFPEKRDFFLENSNLFTMGTGSAFTVDAGADRPVLQPPHRPVGYRHADSDSRRRARWPGSRAATTSACSTSRPTKRSASRATTSSSAATAATSSSARASARIFINKDTVDGSAHYNRTMGVDANLALARNLQINSYIAKTADARQGRQRHGVFRPHRVSRSEVEPVAELSRRAGELQRRGRLRSAHRHPHDQGLLQPDAAAEEAATSS